MTEYPEKTQDAIRAMLDISEAAINLNRKFWVDFAKEFGVASLFISRDQYAERQDFWSAAAVRDALKELGEESPLFFTESDHDSARLGQRRFAMEGAFFGTK